MAVRIITDSAADFEPWELEALKVVCVPLSVTFGEREYQENADLSKEMFYDLLKRERSFPRTSQPSPDAFLAAVRAAEDGGEESVIVTLSSGLSGTYQSACTAKTLSESDRCYVVDSLNGTGGERLLVEYAVRLRDQGRSAREIAEALEDARTKVILYACMDTLEYLHRGGRISHTVYRLGSIAHVKPILHVDPLGRAEIPVKTLGMRKGMDFLCKQIAYDPPDPDYPFCVMYTGNRRNGEVLAQRLRDLGYPLPDHRIVNVGAAVGAHIGPDACGIAYVGY